MYVKSYLPHDFINKLQVHLIVSNKINFQFYRGKFYRGKFHDKKNPRLSRRKFYDRKFHDSYRGKNIRSEI
jgi:hypothetical protein